MTDIRILWERRKELVEPRLKNTALDRENARPGKKSTNNEGHLYFDVFNKK
jgi:hypothetical protein